MDWTTVIYTSFSFLCLAIRIKAEIIHSNGTHIMRKRDDTETYTIIREISDSTLNFNQFVIPCLTVDWREEQVFWFEYTDKAIHTSILDGTLQRMIITKDLEDVTNMAVDERNKILYWSDSRKETIERADYDGKNGRIIHANNLNNIAALAVDSIHALLYWCEDLFYEISSSKTDGSDRKIAYIFDPPDQVPVKIDIDIQQERDSNLLVYWRNWNSTLSFSNCTALFQCRKQELTTEMIEGLRTVSFAIRPKYETYQREGVCKSMGCSHICMPTNETHARCSCPSFGGLVLVSERNCSTVSEPFLLYSDEATGYIGIAGLYPLYPSSDNFLVIKQKKPRGVAYDKTAKMVYFYEELRQTIFNIKIDGTGLMEVLSLQDGQRTTIKALAMDTGQRRLYFTLSDVDLAHNGRYNTRQIYQAGLVSRIRIEALDLESGHRRIVAVGEDINPNILYVLYDRLHFVRNWTCMLSDMDGLRAAQGFCSTNVSNDKLITTDSDLSFVVGEQDESEIIVRQRARQIEIWNGQIKTTAAFNLHGFGRFAIATATIGRHDRDRICDKVSEKKVCEGLCFRTLNERIARCHCPTYRFNVLQEDGRNCSAPTDFLLFSDGIEIRMLGRGRTPDTSVYTIAKSTAGEIESFVFEWPHVYFITRTASSQDLAKRSNGQVLYRTSVESSENETITIFDTPVRLIQLRDNRIYWVSLDGYTFIFGSVSLDGNEKTIHFERKSDVISDVYAFDAYGNVFIMFLQKLIVLRNDVTSDIQCDTPDGMNHIAVVIDDENRILYVATRSNSIEYISSVPEHISCVNKTSVWKRINIQAPNPYEARITTMALSYGRLHVILKSLQNNSVFLKTIDLTMSNITRTEEINAVHPKGLLTFGEERHDSYEPGTVIQPGNCPNAFQESGLCFKYECINDHGCGGDGTICCPGRGLVCRKCAIPVTKHQYIDAICKNCTNGVCNNLTCLPIGNCSVISKLNCCPVCLDVTDCLEKPIIEGCPNDVFNFTLPDDSDSVQIDVNSYPFNTIRGYGCSPERINIQVDLQNTSVTWQRAVQHVYVVAKDMNGESVCKVSVKVRDVTAPSFLSCPSDMEFYSKDQFTTATWFDPVAYDNVAMPPILQQEDKHYQSPMEVSVGAVYSIKYTPKDYEDNRGPPCSFTIHALKLETQCSSPPQIHQGSLFCKGDPDSMECYIKECAKDFIIMAEFNNTFRCQNGQWVPPFNESITTRACLKMEFVSLALELNVDLLDNATETPTSDDVIQCFEKLSLCPEPKTDEHYKLCTEENIKLSRKENILHLEVNATHQLRFNETVEGVKSELNKTIIAISLGFSERSISTFCFDFSGQMQNMSLKENIFCTPGSILLASKINCTMCPPGEYEAGSTCRQCPRGFYTNLPGQTECAKCADDKTTDRIASYSKDHCVSIPTTTSVSNNTFVIVGIVCGTLLLISLIVAVTVFKLKRAKQRGYPTGLSMDEAYMGLSGKSTENPYDKRTSVYDEIPADSVM